MYKIQLPDFEGPFDLLLYFIKRDEINIYDIPIARITEEFLNYVKVMQYFDLELAGEFIFMASTLMYVKTQMLLPHANEDGSSDFEDPRTALVQKILEYKQYKEASYELAEMKERNKYSFYRDMFEVEYRQVEGDNIYKNATLFDLMKAFGAALERSRTQEINHVVEVFKVTIEDKMEMINSFLKDKPSLSFLSIIKGQNRQHIIVTFLAILELMKMQIIYLIQDDNFDDIMITRKSDIKPDEYVEQNELG